MAPPVMATIPALKETYLQLKTRMDKAVLDFRNNLASTRTGRASVHMLDGVKVEAYGSEMPLNQVAQVHAADAQMLTVTPFDPSTIAGIEKALRSPEFGFNPQNDGKIIRIPVPPLTEDRRKEMVKHLHKVLEDHRTAVRNIRRDGNEALKKAEKDKKISEDDMRGKSDEVQKLTDRYVKSVDDALVAKEKEIKTV